MNLIVFDELLKSEFKLIKDMISGEETQFLDIKEMDIKDINNYNNITIYTGLNLNFVSKNMILFIEKLIELKLQKTQINVIFIEKFGENAKIAIDWINSLNSNYNFNLYVQAEISRENLKEELSLILNSTTKKETNISKDNNVTIYTDGACSGNPGAGGWGAILFHGNHKKEISGYEKETTNNKMEITAVIKALEMLKAPCNVELYSDSAYVVNAINLGWLENWKNNKWLGSDKKLVKNIEYWIRLDELMNIHNVHFNKVKGHSDNEFNNRCDELATGEIASHANIE